MHRCRQVKPKLYQVGPIQFFGAVPCPTKKIPTCQVEYSHLVWYLTWSDQCTNHLKFGNCLGVSHTFSFSYTFLKTSLCLPSISYILVLYSSNNYCELIILSLSLSFLSLLCSLSVFLYTSLAISLFPLPDPSHSP